MSGIEQLFVSPWYWLIGGLIIAGLEIVVPGVFLLWIGLGAMIVGLVMLLLPDLSAAAQLLVFAVAILGSVGIGFSIQRRSGTQSGSAEINQELLGLVGRRYEAVEDFAAGRGRIRVGDTTYSAAGTDGIRAGDQVMVVSVDHGVLSVEREGASED